MIKSIPLNKLVQSPRNVRRHGDPAADAELKASIAAHGLLQNLIVRPAAKGKFEVEAGERRRRAMLALADERLLARDHEVTCLVLEDSAEAAVETSLAENFHRLAMNPADEAQAFAALVSRRCDRRRRCPPLRSDCPLRRGPSASCDACAGRVRGARIRRDHPRHCQGLRRDLGSGHPGPRLRAGLLGLLCAQSGQRSGAWSCPGRSGAAIRAPGSLAATPTSPRAAGSSASCSTTTTARSWVDVALLESLAAAKMEEQAKALAAEQGLAWVKPTLDPYASHDLVEGLVRLPAEPAPLTEAELARLDELDASYDEHAAILEDEDSAEEAVAAAEAAIVAIERECQEIRARPPVIAPELKAEAGMILVLSRDGTPVLQPVFYGERQADPAEADDEIEVVPGGKRSDKRRRPCPSAWSTSSPCSAAMSWRCTLHPTPGSRSTSWSSRWPMPIPTTGARALRPRCAAGSGRPDHRVRGQGCAGEQRACRAQVRSRRKLARGEDVIVALRPVSGAAR